MKNFITKYGLVKRWSFEGDSLENELINGFRLYKVKLKNHIADVDLRHSILEFLKDSLGERGYMKNHIDPEVISRHPDLSHDQTSIFCCISKFFNKEYQFVIFQKFKGLKYDGRIYNPRDWIFYGILNDNVLAHLLFPVLYGSLLFTFLVKYDFRINKIVSNELQTIWKFKAMRRTSGPMLWWDRLEAMKDTLYYPLLKYTISSLGDWNFGSCKELFKLYYDESGHVITDDKYKIEWS